MDPNLDRVFLPQPLPRLHQGLHSPRNQHEMDSTSRKLAVERQPDPFRTTRDQSPGTVTVH